MTDSSPEAAAARLREKPFLIETLGQEARTLANVAARRHPLGHAVLYAEVNNGLAAISMLPHGPGKLLAVERVHAAMVARQEEADAETARQAKAQEPVAAQRRLELLAGGCISRPNRDPAVGEAAALLKLRIDAAIPKLSYGDESDFQALLEEIEGAVRSFSATIGAARRSSRARSRCDAAANAVAAVKAAVSANLVSDDAA